MAAAGRQSDRSYACEKGKYLRTVWGYDKWMNWSLVIAPKILKSQVEIDDEPDAVKRCHDCVRGGVIETTAAGETLDPQTATP